MENLYEGGPMGLSGEDISRMTGWVRNEQDLASIKSWAGDDFEFFLVSIFRLLNNVVGGDIQNQQHWMYSGNHQFDGQVPVKMMETREGFSIVMKYLSRMPQDI